MLKCIYPPPPPWALYRSVFFSTTLKWQNHPFRIHGAMHPSTNTRNEINCQLTSCFYWASKVAAERQWKEILFYFFPPVSLPLYCLRQLFVSCFQRRRVIASMICTCVRMCVHVLFCGHWRVIETSPLHSLHCHVASERSFRNNYAVGVGKEGEGGR